MEARKYYGSEAKCNDYVLTKSSSTTAEPEPPVDAGL